MSPDRKGRIAEIGDESRRRIMDAAESLFLERGVDRTSIVDIAERSGISRGSIPWHFQNKEGLVIAVIERAASRYLTANGGPAPATLGLNETMRRFGEWLQDPAAGMLYTVLITALTAEGAVRERYVELHHSWRRTFHAMLRAWNRGEGLADDDLKAHAAVLNGALIGIHVHRHFDPDLDVDAAMSTLTDLLAATIDPT